ncbi:hypothetical protein [Streptomyces cellulosae]|uniref:Gram-positive cocci surface proteins LPxTG domain-containing protein n=1 Tax=Streptomyces cellulosae TaxID=1968 RepID=A0ABW7Y4Q8_STRCE
MMRSPGWRRALASAAMLVAAPLAGAQTAHAQSGGPYPPPYPPPPDCLSLSATTVHAGDRLGFHGTGFAPRQRVEAELRSFAVVLGTFRANRYGEVTDTVTIPRRIKPGSHRFQLIARYPHRKCSVGIEVLRTDNRALPAGPVNTTTKTTTNTTTKTTANTTANTTTYDDKQPTSAGLANTGSEKALALGAAAAGLIAAGGGTMLAVRRRRSS